MVEAGLVERGVAAAKDYQSVGSFQLTESGRLLIKQLPFFLITKNYGNLFEKYTLKYLPDKFIQRVGAFQTCEIVKSVTPVFARIKKLELDAKRFLMVMGQQAFTEEGRIFADRAAHNVEIYVLIGRNTIFPKDVMESPEMKQFKILQASGKAKLKMVDTVNTALYITESQSALMLPNLKGEIDMSMLIVGNNPSFNEWCLDLFNYMWERAWPGGPEKAKIV